jgi:hypothetical protein
MPFRKFEDVPKKVVKVVLKKVKKLGRKFNKGFCDSVEGSILDSNCLVVKTTADGESKWRTVQYSKGVHWKVCVNKREYAVIQATFSKGVVKEIGFNKLWLMATTIGGIQGEEASHLCDNKACVHSDHVIAETHQENMARYGPVKTENSMKKKEEKDKNQRAPAASTRSQK